MRMETAADGMMITKTLVEPMMMNNSQHQLLVVLALATIKIIKQITVQITVAKTICQFLMLTVMIALGMKTNRSFVEITTMKISQLQSHAVLVERTVFTHRMNKV